MNRWKRVLAAGLAVAITACGLVGCGKKGTLPEKQVLDHVYKYETTVLAAYDEVDWGEMDKQTDFNGYTRVAETYLSVSGYAYNVESVDKDYSLTARTVFFGRFDGSAPTEIVCAVSEDDETSVYISEMHVVRDGLAAIVDESKVVGYESGEEQIPIWESKSLLRIYGFDGAVAAETEICPALFDVAETDAEDYFGVSQLFSDGEDIYLTLHSDAAETAGQLYRLGTDGTLKDKFKLADSGDIYFQSLCFCGENRLFVSYYDFNGGGNRAFLLNTETGEQMTITRETFPCGYAVMYNSFGGSDGMYLLDTDAGIYRLDPETATQEQICNFINSDFIFASGSVEYSGTPIVSLGDGRFATLRSSTKDGKTETLLSILEPADPATLTPKYIITVASAGYAYSFEEQVVKFNLNSDAYRIRYVNYSDYNTAEDSTLGAKQLQADILAGNVPDILIADESFSAADYMNKGTFVDLYTYIDGDAALSRDSFLPNVLSACELNGKLYALPTSIYVFGWMGEKSALAAYDGLTMREFAEKVAALPADVQFMREGDYRRDDMLRMLFFINYTDFVDEESGKCSFENDDFYALLEFAKTLPTSARWENDGFDSDSFDWDAYDNMYKDGKAIACLAGVTDFFGFENMTYTFGMLETDLVGVPSRDGGGYTFNTAALKFLISAKSPFADESWRFVRQFLEEDAQCAQEYGFPVILTALNASKQTALDKIAARAASDSTPTGEIIGYQVSSDGVSKPIYDRGERLQTAEDVERIYDIVLSANRQLGYNEQIYSVIAEEASAYFSGEKRAEAVASLIQDRVGIILNETR